MTEEAEETERVFDFSQPVEAFDDQTKRAYYLLRRFAKLNGGELPDGKAFTQSKVIEILGEDYAQSLVINPKCC